MMRFQGNPSGLARPKSPLEAAADFLKGNLPETAVGIIHKAFPGSSITRKAADLLFLCLAQSGTDAFSKGLFDKAYDFYRKAFDVKNRSADVMADLGATAERLGRPEEAVEWLRKSIEQNPDLARAHHSLAHALMFLENYAEGFCEYEYRWPALRMEKPAFAQPEWDGSPLAGRHLVVYAEQGLGDTFMSARFLRRLRGENVTFYTRLQPQLRKVLSGLLWDGTVTDMEPNSFDVHAPLMSLPRLLGLNAGDLSETEPYIVPDKVLTATWAKRLGGHGLKVGINWQGNPVGAIDLGRSLPLHALEPLSQVPGIRLISLQKLNGTDQLRDLPDGMTVEPLGNDVDTTSGAFMDTAAIMANLDLVVTSDTSIAHLAGALGRPLWVLLQKVPDWRWGLLGDSISWYSSARLFRQNEAGQWASPVNSVAEGLRALAEAKG
jgi:hypothetical protein